MRSRSPDSVVRDIGRRIAELRAAKGWTQARFAEALGIAVQNVARMEQGRQEFRVKTLVRVAQKLGCDPADLWLRPSTVRPTRGRPRSTTGATSDAGKARKKR
ncbi:MAG TPA: helix-turn-helix transcriptional regulator [Polyangiaceae bacterium]|nr:helix-turn-helix transcriptional regulator [Polyangiaceae bacterium]